MTSYLELFNENNNKITMGISSVLTIVFIILYFVLDKRDDLRTEVVKGKITTYTDDITTSKTPYDRIFTYEFTPVGSQTQTQKGTYKKTDKTPKDMIGKEYEIEYDPKNPSNNAFHKRNDVKWWFVVLAVIFGLHFLFALVVQILRYNRIKRN
jgi:hypothetical protein